MNEDSVSNVSSTILTYHRIAEAFKFAFAKRSALGDEDFVDVSAVSFNYIRLSSFPTPIRLMERYSIDNKKLSYCWETVRRDSMPRIAEMDVKMTT